MTILEGEASVVALRLLGCELISEIDGERVRVKIVETEAYDQSDAASHSYKGPTARNKIMFGKAGYLYVYFTYGMHYCANIVTGEAGHGSGVLIRAVEPLENEAVLERRRNIAGVNLTNGPAKLTKALGINKTFNGHNLRESPLRLIVHKALPKSQIVTTTRIGITKSKELPLRFYIKSNPYVSHK